MQFHGELDFVKAPGYYFLSFVSKKAMLRNSFLVFMDVFYRDIFKNNYYHYLAKPRILRYWLKGQLG